MLLHVHSLKYFVHMLFLSVELKIGLGDILTHANFINTN